LPIEERNFQEIQEIKVVKEDQKYANNNIGEILDIQEIGNGS